MPSNRDLMERLAAADPFPDAEQLRPEQRRDPEALLARLLAAPVDSTARPNSAHRRPNVRRWGLVAAGAVVSVVAAVVAVGLLESNSPGGTSVVNNAVAAVTQDDSVYHIVELKRGRLRACPGETWAPCTSSPGTPPADAGT